jgi:hypothetical protein
LDLSTVKHVATATMDGAGESKDHMFSRLLEKAAVLAGGEDALASMDPNKVPEDMVRRLKSAYQLGKSHGKELLKRGQHPVPQLHTAAGGGGRRGKGRSGASFHTSRGRKDPLEAFGILRSKDVYRGARLQPWARTAMHAICLTSTAAIIGDTVGTAKSMGSGREHRDLVVPVVKHGVFAASIPLWISVFDATVGIHRVIAEPRLMIGFMLPMLLNGINMTYAMNITPETAKEMKELDKNLSSDASAVISAGFAMGTLMAGLKTVTGTRIIMYALICALALVIPSSRMPPASVDRVVVQTIQHAVLMCAISFVVTAILMDSIQEPVTEDTSLPGGSGAYADTWVRDMRAHFAAT